MLVVLATYGLSRMCTQTFWHAALKLCTRWVLQGDPADSVFFIEEGDCQVGYNQRRTADEDLISTVSSLSLVCTDGPCMSGLLVFSTCRA